MAVNTHPDILKVCHWNCFALNQSKKVELELFLKNLNPDIVCLNEMKLNQEVANLFLRFNLYTTYYKPRLVNPNRGGGLAKKIYKNLSNTCSWS